MALLWIRLGAVVFALAAVLALIQAVRPQPQGERKIFYGLLIALGFQALSIGQRALDVDGPPIASIRDGIVLFSLLSGTLALVISWRGGVPQVAMLSSPLLALFAGIAALAPPGAELPEGVRSAWLVVHICLALLGDAVFAIAGLVSVVYLVQERRLKRKKRARVATGLHHLPALEVLDNVSATLFKLGFPFMTLGLATGVLYMKHVTGSYWSWEPQNAVSLMVWALYALMMHARWLIGWRGRRAALLTLLGVIVVLLTFVGFGVAGVGIHGREMS